MVYKRNLKAFFQRLFACVLHCALGAAVFYSLENNSEYYNAGFDSVLYNRTKFDVMQRFRINDTDFDSLVSMMCDVMRSCKASSREWSYVTGLDLALQTITTIGYGNKTPVTLNGQMFLIVFAMIGIPLTVLMFKSFGENSCYVIGFIVTKFEKHVLKKSEVKKLELKCLILINIVAFAFTCVMSFVSIQFHIHWSFGQAVYAWFVTYSTIGFGDFIPGQGVHLGMFADFFRIAFMIIGLGFVSTIISSISDFIESRRCPCPGRRRSRVCKPSTAETTNGETDPHQIGKFTLTSFPG